MPLVLGVSLVAPAQTPQRVILPGHLPAAISYLQPLGRLERSTQIKLSIDLPLHNREGLTNLIEQLYDPASPLYHHYLSAEEFDARFGPTEQDYQAVVDWAAASGCAIVARHPNRMMLQVSASAADLERALQVALRTYAHPTESRTFFAPDTEPSVPAGVPILSLGGLESFARPHPASLHRTPLKSSPRPMPEMGSGPNGNLAGFDYRAAYVPGTTLTGTGQSVGLVEFDGYYATDITTYESMMGLPNVPLQVVTLEGFNSIPTTGANSGNSEVALDIEMAISMAPGLSKVVVFESNPTSGVFNNVLLAMSTNTAIKQLSCSWTAGPITGAQRTAMDNYFLKFGAQGQSFFAASGDNGATAGAIPAPDDDPYITVVGGTVLATAGPAGPWLWEEVWNSQEGPGFNATGGGVSTTTAYNIPSWQKGVSMTTNHGSTTKRNVPDVAMVADNIFIVADNGQQETTGGTSAAAPLWAGFAALVNQQALSVGATNIGFVNPALYQIGTNSGYAACFDDITVGNNTNTSTSQYLAVPGYDLCTGWGSPAGNSLIIALTQPDGFQVTPARGPVANGPVGGPFTTSSQTFSLTNSGKSTFNWALGNSATWLGVSSRAGSLAPGGGTTSVSVSLTPAANQLSAGIYTAALWFTNLASGLTQLRQFTIQVGQELVQDGGFEAGDLSYWVLSGADVSIYTNNFSDNGYYTGYTPYAGNYFAAFGQVGNLAYLSQPLATRAGQLYLLSFWLQNSSGLTPNEFAVQWNTNSASTSVVFDQQNMSTFDWTQMQFVVQAASKSTILQFGGQSDYDFLCLDNVSVVPVPAPVIQVTPQPGGTMQLAWTALAGVQYQAQYKTNLTQTGWLNLGSAITATNSAVTALDPVMPAADRFYRVQVVP